MMKMLEAGGLPPLADNIRTADNDNPKGYYELERVKKLEFGDTAWLMDAQGKAVKIIFTLLPYLPKSGFKFRAIFMRRALPEILASQRKMLIARGKDPDKISDEEMTRLYEKHIGEIYHWARSQSDLTFIDVNFNSLMASPIPQLESLNSFLDNSLQIEAMAKIIDTQLYRQRHQ